MKKQQIQELIKRRNPNLWYTSGRQQANAFDTDLKTNKQES
jgi:hypothetical protein